MYATIKKQALMQLESSANIFIHDVSINMKYLINDKKRIILYKLLSSGYMIKPRPKSKEVYFDNFLDKQCE